jgi:hypothetical protein
MHAYGTTPVDDEDVRKYRRYNGTCPRSVRGKKHRFFKRRGRALGKTEIGQQLAN